MSTLLAARRESGLAHRLSDDVALRRLGYAVIVTGIALRTYHFLLNKSLWGDESYLAVNLVRLNFDGLLEPLAFNQSAPVGYLLLTKLSIVLFGSSEYALRLLSYLSGCGAVVLSYLVPRRLFGYPAALISVVVVALSPAIIYYSTELKQYETELFITLVLLLLFTAYRSDHSTQRLLNLGIIGALACYFSLPVVFILGGMGLGLIYEAHRSGSRTLAYSTGTILLLWFAGFLINYLIFVGPNTNVTRMQGFWANHFVRFDSVFGFFRWWARMAWQTLENPMGLQHAVVAIPVMGMGVLELYRRDKVLVIAGLATCAVLVLASAMQLYPLHKRFLLFLAPYLAILLALGIVFLLKMSRTPMLRIVAMLVVTPIAGTVAWNTVANTVNPINLGDYRQEIRPVLEKVLEWRMEDEPLYLHENAKTQMMYYGFIYNIDDAGSDWLHGYADMITFNSRTAYQLKRHSKGKNAWVVFSRTDEEEVSRSLENAGGERADSIAGVNASAFHLRWDS